MTKVIKRNVETESIFIYLYKIKKKEKKIKSRLSERKKEYSGLFPGNSLGIIFFRQFYLQIFTHLFSIPQSQHRFINLLTLDEIKPPPHNAFYRLSIEKLQFLNSNHFTSIVHNQKTHLILYHLLPIWIENSWNVKSKLEKFERKYFSLLRIDVVVEISSEKSK